jgi:hypothetical protein
MDDSPGNLWNGESHRRNFNSTGKKSKYDVRSSSFRGVVTNLFHWICYVFFCCRVRSMKGGYTHVG